jgi:g-D-glutamyl-meso-diaminopimelate peptidase
MNIVKELFDKYANFNGEKGVLGYTTLGHPIPYFEVLGNDSPVIFMQGAIHAREYITAKILLEYLCALQVKTPPARFVIAPIINIDGVKITKTLPQFKANARGVDLNVNFPAKWGSGEKNSKIRGTENFIGTHPLSEMESKSLASFTRWLSPDITVSFHSKGREIYYDFYDEKLKQKHKPLAKVLSDATGYKLVENISSAGGYKDWVLQNFGVPSFTIEVGSDDYSHPIPIEEFSTIYKELRNLPKVLIESYLAGFGI